MKRVSKNVLSAIDTASQNGEQIDSNQLIQASFQPIFGDATAVGVVKVQMSNDVANCTAQPGDFVVTNWSDIPGATSAVAAGVGAPISLANMAFRWIRVVYTRTSGGSTTVNVNMLAMSI